MTELGLGFAGYRYMQDINGSTCLNASIGEEGRLMDLRDSKVYWVARLHDGACWMTQNLDLDLTTSGLTASLSDLSSDWNQSSTGVGKPTQTIVGSTPTGWPNSGNDYVGSYDPGYNVYVNGKTSTATTSDLAYGKPAGSFTIQDAHYLQGNYYSFNAAAAGTGQNKTNANQNAESSICPKGWKLPISGKLTVGSNSFEVTTPGSFGALAMGVTKDTIYAAPYYFVYGGDVLNGALQGVSSNGYYWSSTAYDATQAYYLLFDSSNIYPSYNNSRFAGQSVRCVAR